MIDPSMIEEVEDCDGESVHCYGLDTDSDEWTWQWVPVEVLHDYGKQDVLRAAGMYA